MRTLDGRAIRFGAIVDLAILMPLVVVYLIIRGNGSPPASTVVIVTATLLAPIAGGFAAGRRQLAAPLTNGAAAAGVAVVAYIAFRLVDAAIRGRGLHLASIAIFATLSVTLGLLGGFTGFRTAKR